MNDEFVIVKTLTTRCIGYRHNRQGGLDTVYEETVLFADGTEGTVWGGLNPPCSPATKSLTTHEHGQSPALTWCNYNPTATHRP